jgi:aspartate racemase
MKKIGIAAHSYEGGALCFLEVCREGARREGAHMHPEVLMSAIPMGLSLDAWEEDDHELVWQYLQAGIEQVTAAGADFFVCPDNTAHIVLEQYANAFPVRGLHIAHVVCHEIAHNGWTRVGLLGTKWTMTGPVYANALEARGMTRYVPDEKTRLAINDAIFDELCQGVFATDTIDMFRRAIDDLKARGAECVVLGCTEIPLIIDNDNSSLPVLDSTRLLARYAVQVALMDMDIKQYGWIDLQSTLK